jgi:hypothetical protein
MATPSLAVKGSSGAAAAPSPPAGATTARTGSPNCCANSKSRASWAGTAMMAPLPYDPST